MSEQRLLCLHCMSLSTVNDWIFLLIFQRGIIVLDIHDFLHTLYIHISGQRKKKREDELTSQMAYGSPHAMQGRAQ